MFDFSRTCKHLKGEAEATRPKKEVGKFEI
jgi:hypothetical protein